MPTTLAPARNTARRKAPASAGSSAGSGARLRGRAAALRERLGAAGCDGLLVTNPADIRYLTGFRGEDSTLLVSRDSLTVLSDFRFAEELEAVRGVADVHIRSGAMHEAVGVVAKAAGVSTLGVQAEHMTVDARRRLAKAVRPAKLKDTLGLLRSLRMVKDEGEIALIRKAIGVQEESLVALLETIGPGDTERAIAARLEFEMKSRGAERAAFEPIIAAGANGSLPHYVPAGAKLKSGQTLLIDWGARVDGYVSDMTRTFSFGRWPKEMARVYKVCLEAHEAGIAAVAPGVRTRDVDAAARKVIEAAGYGPRFGHGLGHGIGLDVHESPRVGRESEETLAPGMVVTIEPGIYLPGIGGVRIEDDVLVTERGGRSLCSLPKDMEWATR